MSYLLRSVDMLSDDGIKLPLKRVIEKALPELRSLPASLTHHRHTGGAHEFACKVVRTMMELHKVLKANEEPDGIGITQDEALFVALISCLDIPSRYRRGEMLAVTSDGKSVYQYLKTDDLGVEPAFFIASKLFEEGFVLSPEVFHALSFREGGFAKNQSKTSAQDMSPLASLLHSAYTLSMNFRQTNPDVPSKEVSVL